MSSTSTEVREVSTSGSEAGKRRICVLRTVEELESIRAAWNQWCDDPNADLELYLAWARWHDEFVRPHVIVVYRGEEPDCILVARLEQRRLEIKLGYATVLRPKVRQIAVQRFGFLGNNSDENLDALALSLREALGRGEADLAEIPRPRPMPALDAAIAKHFQSVQRGRFAPEHEHRWVELPDSYEAFLQSLSRKDRHELRRHEKKLKEDFTSFEIRCFHGEGEVETLARELEKISQKTYQRALGVGFKADNEMLESLRITARQGGLRGCILYVGEQPAAFFLARAYKHRLHGNFMGFDPQFSKYSAGMKILMHAIEDCYDPANPIREVDLGWGDRRYKRMICNRECRDGRLYVYAPSLKDLALNILRSGISAADYYARKAIENSAFFQKLKKAWVGRRASAAGAGTRDERDETAGT